MNEKLIKCIASMFRIVPHFRGKYRIGKKIQKIIFPSNKWKNPVFFIKLKNNTHLLIDITSAMNHIPFWTGRRDAEIIELIIKNSLPNWVVFDIGANIGTYTIPIAKKLGKLNGKIHTFEPLKENIDCLEQSITINKVNDKVVFNKYALGDFEGTIDIIKTEHGKSSNAVLSFNDKEYEKGLTKEVVTIKMLDNYINHVDRCDFIKVDIEGAEYFMIKGGLKFIEKYKPIIYGEFNSYFLNKFGFTLLDVWELLQPMGYTSYVEDRKNKGTFKRTEIKEELEDLLFFPPHIKNLSDWGVKLDI